MDIKYSFFEASKIDGYPQYPVLDINNFDFACHKHKKKIENTLIKQPYPHISEQKNLWIPHIWIPHIHIVTLRYPKSGL